METNEILNVILDKISDIDGRISQMENKFDKRFDEVAKRFDVLERKVDGIVEQTADLMEFRNQTIKDIAGLKEENVIKALEEVLKDIINGRR